MLGMFTVPTSTEPLLKPIGGIPETKNFDSFEFSLRALVKADGKTLSTEFHRGPAVQ